VSESFSISRSLSSVMADPDLRELIGRHTGNLAEADSIVRSIRRFGNDGSIGRYDLTPEARRGTRHGGRTVTWNVRAVRP